MATKRHKHLRLLLFAFFSGLFYFHSDGQSFLQDRDPVLLDGPWMFYQGLLNPPPIGELDEYGWQKVAVPHSYNAVDAQTSRNYYKGPAWYRYELEVPDNYKGKRIFLRFEGVNSVARVFVNGHHAGNHKGGYSAFVLEITDFAVPGGKNLLVVKVNNELVKDVIPTNDKLFNVYGGIYRPVTLFATSEDCIDPLYSASPGMFIRQKSVTPEHAALEITTRVSKTSSAGLSLKYSIVNAHGDLVATKKVPVDEAIDVNTGLDIEHPVLWNGKKNPYLYQAKAELMKGEEVLDVVTQPLGIRSFKVDPGKGFFLNDAPYKVRGVNRHQEWQGLGNALEFKHHKADMQLIDEMGASAVRLCHYQQADDVYSLADTMGMIVWAEIPYVASWTGFEQENAKQQLRELILQNYNHPSVIFWGLWNEVRTGKVTDPPVLLVRELNEIAQELDPDRYTVSASDKEYTTVMNWESELQAWNKYFGWYYGEPEDLKPWLDGAHKELPDSGLGISEYGIGGNIFQQDSSKLEKPVGRYFPEPVQAEYHETTWQQLDQSEYLWGTFIWCMYDFSVAGWNRGGIPYLNHKGMITADRTTKKDVFYFYKANWSEQPVVHIAGKRRNSQPSTDYQLKVYTNQSMLEVYVNGQKEFTVRPSEYGIVRIDDVKLNRGQNFISVIGRKGKMTFADKVEIMVTD